MNNSIRFAALVCLLCVFAAPAGAQQTIRVGLQMGASRFTIDAPELVAQGIGRWRGNVLVTPSSEGIALNHKVITAQTVFLTPTSGRFTLDGHPYRGSVEVHLSTSSTVDAINVVELEDYVAGVVGGEIPSSWPDQALQAQAVASRSYALAKMGETRTALYDVLATDRDQVYEGLTGASARIQHAVQKTQGEVLTYGGNIVKAYFHASCGGHTENSRVVFGESAAYLQGVDDTWCEDSPYQHWDREYTIQQLQKALESLGLPLEGQIVQVRAQSDESGRVESLTVISEKGEQVVRGIDLRRVLGYRELRSTRFTVSISRTIPVYIDTTETGVAYIPETIDINLEETLPKYAGIHIDHKMVLMNQQGQLSRKAPLGLKALTATYRKTPQTIQHGVVVLGMERKVTLTRFEVQEQTGVVHHKKIEKQMPVEFAFDGEGWGHGVGMCQWGCRGMARQGMSYLQILAHYYPGTTVSVLTTTSR